MILKTLSLQEANGLLPLVRERFHLIQHLLKKGQKLKDQCDELESDKYKIKRNDTIIKIHKRKGPLFYKKRSFHKDLQKVELAIQNEVEELLRYGVFVKNLFEPHIDFMSIRNHQPVYLCWHGGEKEITHWHSLNDLGPNRFCIKETNSFGPIMVH